MGEQVPLTKRQPERPPAAGSRNKHPPLFSSFPPLLCGAPQRRRSWPQQSEGEGGGAPPGGANGN